MLSQKTMYAAMYAVILAVLLYIGYAVYDAGRDPMQTVLAAESRVEKTAEMTGWVIREEQLLSGSGTDITVIASEGQRLACGEAYAALYSGQQAKDRVSQRSVLEQRAAQIRSVLHMGGSAAKKAPEAAAALAGLAATGELATLDEVTLAVETYVLESGHASEASLARTLAELETELEMLTEAAASDTLAVCTEQAGYYSAGADGYEGVSMSSALLPSETEAMMSSQVFLPADCVGKLVTGIRWQYAAILSAADAAALTPGDTVEARFPGLFQGTVSLRVESVSAPESGRQTVLFSSTDRLDELLSVRKADGQLVLAGYTGLRIPAGALYTDADTGEAYVYVVEGVQAKRKTVTLLGEYDGSCYAAPGELRAGMEIITKANDLSDGKVVR